MKVENYRIEGAIDLVGKAYRLYRDDFPSIARVLMLPALLSIPCTIAMQYVSSLVTSAKTISDDLIAAGVMLVVFLISGICLTVIFFELLIRQMGMVTYFLGVADNLKSGISFCRAKFGWVFLSLLVLGCLMFASVIVWCIPLAIGIAICSLLKIPTLFYFLVLLGFVLGLMTTSGITVAFWFFLLVILACEPIGFGAAMEKAISYVFSSFFRCLGFNISLFVTQTSLRAPLSLPAIICPLFVALSKSGFAGVEGEVPILMTAFMQGWLSLVDIMVLPVPFLAFAQLYRDIKVRREGLDIEAMIEKLA